MAKVIVVGAGISGLATAWFLQQQGHNVRVLEATNEPGGSIRTENHDAYRLDLGPNSALDRGEALHGLINELGLDRDVVEANPTAQRRYIVKHDRLVPLPTNPLSFLTTPLFTARGKLRLFLEPVYARAAAEESIAAFVRRRLGREFLDWAIDPFVSGVYAGDPARLSVRAATAKVYALEAEHGSLFIGAVARLLRGRRTGPAPGGRLIAFRQGMQALPLALGRALDGALITGAAVTNIGLVNREWQISTAGDNYIADHLIISTPAYQAAALLGPLDPTLGDLLKGISYPPVATVTLGFSRHQVGHPLDGFGALIPRHLGITTLGVLFSSTLFPERAPPGQVLLTAFIGGARNAQIAEWSSQDLLSQVLADLRPLLTLSGEPVYAQVHLWPRAIPQYELGHLDRLAAIDTQLHRWPGLHLQANWRGGISVSDCVSNAQKLAHAMGHA